MSAQQKAGVDVLAELDRRIEIGELFGQEHDIPGGGPGNAALKQARAAVAELIEAAKSVDGVADHASFVSDECCCGSRMDAHDMGSGHAPVDSGTYYGGQALDRLRAALARVQGGAL